MCAMAAAAIVIMKTEVFSAAAEQTRAVLQKALQALLQGMVKVFLPHLLLGLAIGTMAGAAAFYSASTLLEPYPALKLGWGMILFIFCGGAAVLYGLATAGLFALRLVGGQVEDFIYAFFTAVKEKALLRVDNMEESLAKERVKQILAGSINEASSVLKNYRFQTVASVLATVVERGVIWMTKSVLFSRVVKLPGKAVSLSAVFSGRATLVGAILLNFQLLSGIVLWGLYLAGAGFFLFNMLVVFAGK